MHSAVGIIISDSLASVLKGNLLIRLTFNFLFGPPRERARMVVIRAPEKLAGWACLLSAARGPLPGLHLLGWWQEQPAEGGYLGGGGPLALSPLWCKWRWK